MIKQTVSYGVWTLNRHDDNKIEVLKNGQVCEKASPAYREIAAEIGFEIDPEWRTSQLGRNVFKAVENAAENGEQRTLNNTEEKTAAPEKAISQTTSAIEECTFVDVILEAYDRSEKIALVKAIKELLDIGLKDAMDIVDAAPGTIVKGVDKSTAETIKSKLENIGAEVKICSKTQAPTTNASQKKYDVNSIENSEDYYRNDPMLRAFYKENRNYTKEQFDALLSKAVAGDAIAQYQCGYIFALLSRIQYTIEGRGKCSFDDGTLERYSKITDVSQATTLATEWLTKSAEQGFGLAMFELGDHYTHGPLCKFVPAVHWKDRCKEVNPWRSNYELYCNFDQQGQRAAKYPKLLQDLELKKGVIQLNIQEIMELKEINSKAEKQYNELEQQYHKIKEKYHQLQDKYFELKKEYKDLEDREEKAHEKYRELKESTSSSSSNSSSSSRSSSSSSDSVRVKVTFNTDSRLFNMVQGTTRTVTISETEYKSLVKGSMKARVAWIHGKFGVASSITVSDVSIISLD